MYHKEYTLDDFRTGPPRICVPLTCETLPQLFREAQAAAALPADLYEFRADFFRESPSQALRMLRDSLPRPLIFTLRTKGQGGQADISGEEYERRLLEIINLDQDAACGLLDIELACQDDRVLRLVRAAKSRGMLSIVSHHDFAHTPDSSCMLDLLRKMRSLGADLPKLAVMPSSPKDVLSLMEVTLQASMELGPVVTMSMGRLGQLSRIGGGLTGSVISFAAGPRPSAPGQLMAADLRSILDILC